MMRFPVRGRGQLIELSTAHFWVDCYSSMLGAFLPFLHRQLGITLTQAGLLGGILIFSGSFLQPAYGVLADRVRGNWFVVLGPAIAGIFISTLGLADDFATAALLVFLGGIGIAAFHPQGTACAGHLPQDESEQPHKGLERKGIRLSFFITAGILGYSLGPLLITSWIAVAGLPRSAWAAAPGVVITLYLWARHSKPAVHIERPSPRELLGRLHRRKRALLLLYLLVVIRSAVQMVMVAFLPLFMITRGYSELEAGQILTLFLFTGAVSGFFGGILADTIGGRPVILLSCLFLPVIAGFLLTEGAVSLLLCAIGGGLLLLTLPVNISMAQQLVPDGASTVSALMMGFAWGVGGLAVPVVGIVSDSLGLHTTLLMLLVPSLASLPLAWMLPRIPTPSKQTTQPATAS